MTVCNLLSTSHNDTHFKTTIWHYNGINIVSLHTLIYNIIEIMLYNYDNDMLTPPHPQPVMNELFTADSVDMILDKHNYSTQQ